jgi:hypothetical protein
MVICTFDGCSKRASFNYTDFKPRLCGNHKKDGMVNVNHSKCIHGKRKSNCSECDGINICEHGKHKAHCKLCGGSQICIHGKNKHYCKDCDGSGLCEHGKSKYTCVDCDGLGVCEHGRRKYNCTECEGAGICEHGKRRNRCKDCDGSQICEHGKDRYSCKECEGTGICVHGKRKQLCKECDGSFICEHGKNKRYCRDCNGSGICEHGKVKYYCKECNGSCICEHGKDKFYCKDCSGNGICDHGRIKYVCKDCHGSCICEHGKIKRFCKECDGSGICVHGRYKTMCKDCGTRMCESEACSIYENKDKAHGRYRHNGELLCTNCYNHIVLGDNPKTMVRKEQFVLAELQRLIPELEEFFVVWDCPIDGGCSNKRPDLLYDFGIACLVIEIDENGHKYEDPTCRNKRMCEIYKDLAERPIVFVRFNPDKYKERESMFKLSPKTKKLSCNEVEFQYRMEKLHNYVYDFYNEMTCSQEIPNKLFDVINLFI